MFMCVYIHPINANIQIYYSRQESIFFDYFSNHLVKDTSPLSKLTACIYSLNCAKPNTFIEHLALLILHEVI